MPSARYPLQDGGPERLEITWQTSLLGGWKNIAALLDGRVVGTVHSHKELKDGQVFFLPGGSALGVQLLGAPFVSGLRVVLDGQPLSGSVGEMAEPAQLTRDIDSVVAVLCLFGALNVAGGLLSVFAPSGYREFFALDGGVSPVSIAFGMAQLGLVLPIRRRSTLALTTAVMVTVLEGFVGSYLIAQHHPYRDITLLVLAMMVRAGMMNIFPLSVMAQGTLALRKLKHWQPSTT